MDLALDVLLTPAEFEALARGDLSRTTCVVFDVLRATSSMLVALANGAQAVIPVADIDEALAWKARRPAVLLAGERGGVRILAGQSGGVDFDLGNSPREFTAARVQGREVIMTTTNGTRALRACAGAEAVLVASFLNLGAVTDWLHRRRVPRLVLVCGGTHEEAALEDTLAAGALCHELWPVYGTGHVSDAAQMARQLHFHLGGDLAGAMTLARNGRRLLEHPELREDVTFCLQRDTLDFVAVLDAQGAVRCRA